MAIFKIDQPAPFSDVLGAGLGTGLGQGLQQLAMNRLQQMQQQQLSSALQNLGVPSQVAYLEPRSQLEAIKYFLPQQSNQNVNNALESIIGGNGQPQQADQLQGLLSSLQQPSGIDSLSTDQAPQAMVPQKQESIVPSMGQQIAKQRVQKPDGAQQSIIEKPSKIESPGAQMVKEQDRFSSLLKDPSLSAQEKNKLRVQLDKRHEKLSKEQDKIDKSTQKFYDRVNDESRAAREGNDTLDKMLNLVNTGKLSGPITSSILDALEHGIPILGIGVNLYGLTSSETQEFRKLQGQFLRNVKNIFGARVTNDEVKRYINSIPSLTQTDEGKRRVIRDMRLFNEATLAKKNTLDEILQENDGYRPRNIEQLIDQRAKPVLDKISERFKEEYVSPQELQREYEARKNPVGRALTSIFGS